MARMMTKSAIIDQLSKKSALTKKQMSEILDSLATLAYLKTVIDDLGSVLDGD